MHTILIIDDDPTNSQLLKLLLEMDGYEVMVASNLSQARALLTRHMDACVIDYYLAYDLGLNLVKEIRASQTSTHPATVIIMTSGDDRCRTIALQEGADSFLQKPFSPSDLSAELTQRLTL